MKNHDLSQLWRQSKTHFLRQSQVNSILERVHQIIGSIYKHLILDNENPWNGILAVSMFTLCTLVHITMQHSPAQLVFGQD